MMSSLDLKLIIKANYDPNNCNSLVLSTLSRPSCMYFVINKNMMANEM